MTDEDRQIKYIKVGMDFTKTVTRRILDNLEGGEKDEHLEQMKGILLDYIKMENEYNTSKKVLAKLKKGLEVENSDMNKDVEAEFREKLKEEMDSNNIKAEDLKRDPKFLQLEQVIDGGNPIGDDDLVMTQESETFQDPWTRKLITDEPITNKKCGHTYEKATVMRFIERNSKSKKPLKCPVMGCANNNIVKSDLYTDPEVKNKVARQNRK